MGVGGAGSGDGDGMEVRGGAALKNVEQAGFVRRSWIKKGGDILFNSLLQSAGVCESLQKAFPSEGLNTVEKWGEGVEGGDSQVLEVEFGAMTYVSVCCWSSGPLPNGGSGPRATLPHT